MLSRRGFLIGAGGLLTAAFVKDAGAFVRRTKQPLLVCRHRRPRPCVGTITATGLLLTLGD